MENSENIFKALDHFLTILFLIIKNNWTISKVSPVPVFLTLSTIKKKNLSLKCIQKDSILCHSRIFLPDHSKNLTFWISSECSHYGGVNNFTFWTLPEFLHSWPFKNFQMLYHSRMFTFWTILTFWTISDFSNSEPFHNFDILDDSQFFKFCTLS